MVFSAPLLWSTLETNKERKIIVAGTDTGSTFLEIICVTYARPRELRVLVASLACQTNPNFLLKIIHDGPSVETRECVVDLQRVYPELAIIYQETEKRFNDQGDSLRAIGLMDSVHEFVLLTNDDNYYVPVFVEEIQKMIERESPDIIYYDMIHGFVPSHPSDQIPYQTLITEPRVFCIDIGSFVFKGLLGKLVGYNNRSPIADGLFFEEMKATNPKISKIPKVLFVHN